MQQDKNLKQDGFPKPSTVQPRKVVLTPEQELKAKLDAERFDRDLRELFKNGLDLSGQDTP